MAFTVTVTDRHELELAGGKTCDFCLGGCAPCACPCGSFCDTCSINAEQQIFEPVAASLSPLED
jgi:hypothetical protein